MIFEEHIFSFFLIDSSVIPSYLNFSDSPPISPTCIPISNDLIPINSSEKSSLFSAACTDHCDSSTVPCDSPTNDQEQEVLDPGLALT